MTWPHIIHAFSTLTLHCTKCFRQQKRAMIFVGTNSEPYHAGLQKAVSTFSTKNTTSLPHTKKMARQRGYPEMEVGLSVCDWIISSQHVVIIQRIVSIKIQSSKNRTTHPTTTKVFAQNLVRQNSRADRPKSIRFPVSPFWRSAQHVSPVCFLLRSTYLRFSLSQQVIHTYSSRNSLGSIESAKKTTCICIYIYWCVRVSLEFIYI